MRPRLRMRLPVGRPLQLRGLLRLTAGSPEGARDGALTGSTGQGPASRALPDPLAPPRYGPASYPVSGGGHGSRASSVNLPFSGP